MAENNPLLRYRWDPDDNDYLQTNNDNDYLQTNNYNDYLYNNNAPYIPFSHTRHNPEYGDNDYLYNNNNNYVVPTLQPGDNDYYEFDSGHPLWHHAQSPPAPRYNNFGEPKKNIINQMKRLQIPNNSNTRVFQSQLLKRRPPHYPTMYEPLNPPRFSSTGGARKRSRRSRRSRRRKRSKSRRSRKSKRK